jgi:hypothetical protein
LNEITALLSQSQQRAVAERRMRRWLQFGILDLLILTAIVAVVLPLCPRVEGKGTKALPAVVGLWVSKDPSSHEKIDLYPDGTYWCVVGGCNDRGASWTLTRSAEVESAFVLACGETRFIIRSEWRSGEMELLNADGSVRASLQEWMLLDGPMQGNLPHGTWIGTHRKFTYRYDYRGGELVDLQINSKRSFLHLNHVRGLRGLPPLRENNFATDGSAKLPTR